MSHPATWALRLARPSARAVTGLKVALFAVSLAPAARLVWLTFTGGLGPNPVEFLTRSTGTWTLVFLCIALTVTPLRRWSGWNWLARTRRMFGLFAFFYAACHFTIYLWFDQDFDVDAMLKDVLKRPFITAGFAAFVLLVPLAATSFDAAARRLGGARWRRLHQAVYLIAPIGVLHYWWHKAGKNDLFQPRIYAAVVVVLLFARAIHAWRSRAGGRVQRAT